MTVFKAPPDFIALILSIGFITVLAVALTSENPLIFNGIRILNYNYIIICFYLVPFFFEGYILNYYTPNYQFIKLLFPVKLISQFFIDILFEILSYKIFLIIFFFLALIISSKYYEIVIWSGFNIIGVTLIILSYINSCLLIRVVKDKMKKNSFNFHKKFFQNTLFYIDCSFYIKPKFKAY